MTKNQKSTFNQMLIRDLIRKHRNDYVGWNESSYIDNGTTWSKNPSVKDAEEYIYNAIMNSKEKYQGCEVGLYIETKHIRFMGKDWIKDEIKKFVDASYRNGWHFPHAK